MSSIERVNALLGGQPIDQVPVYHMGKGFCAKCVGYDLASMYNDPEKSFWAQQWTSEIFDIDSLIPRSSYHSGYVLEFGGEVQYPTGEWSQSPSVTRRPVNSEEDISKLLLPEVQTLGTGYVPTMMEFCKLSEKFGLPIVPHAGTPLTQAENLCGTDLLLRWMIRKPELVHRLLRLVTDYFFQVVKYWVDTFGGERLIVYEAGSVESNQLNSPKQFSDFAFPYLKELNERILALGVRHIFCHICGEQNLNLPYWAQVPMGNPGIISVGHEVDLTAAIEYFGDGCIIAGNLETAIIQEGTPQQVYELACQCLEKAKHAPRGYVLMPGCELPPNAPPYNVYIIKKAVNDFSRYN